MAHTADHENHFIKVFIGVLVVLTIFTLLCVALARSLTPAIDADADLLLRAETLKRIAPAGSVNTSEDQISSAVTAVAMVSAPESTDDLVQQSCATCHSSGAAGAPRLDDDEAWAQRRELGLDALVASVVNGKGNMPARAGTQYSDEDLRRAVVAIAGFEADAGGETSGAADASTTDTAAAGAAAVAELTPRVKGVVDSVCVACHLAGVGGAPKLGDPAAWAERAEKGLEGMAAVVASGKGAMPARGGSDLTDEELVAAVEYLISK